MICEYFKYKVYVTCYISIILSEERILQQKKPHIQLLASLKWYKKDLTAVQFNTVKIYLPMLWWFSPK